MWMKLVSFKGFGGVRIDADLHGDVDAPPVLLIHDAFETRAEWLGVADALTMAGRQVINVDLRGHGSSEWPIDGRYEFDALVEDVKSVVAQLPARPVIIGAGLGGSLAIAALGEAGAHLASGLVLLASGAPGASQPAQGRIDPRFDGAAPDYGRLIDAAPRLALPVLALGGRDGPVVSAIADAELADIDAGDSVDSLGGLLLDFLERRVPLAPPEYREGSDARTFRDALGCFATGVTVITAMNDDGEPIGLTANSFTSVSLDPPLLLVCIARSSGSAAIMERTEHFAVNVLQIGQQPTSNRFAGKGEDRFASTPWTVGEYGTPVLTGSLGSFECARHAVHDGGDHFILVGRVLKAMFEPRRDPLLYFRGRYRRLHFA